MGRRLIDLSMTITPKVAWAQWPRRLVGEEEPVVDIQSISTMKNDGVYYCKFEMATQCFTHMDAPSHYDENGINCDEVPLETLVGEGVVIDVTYKKPGEAVTSADLEKSNVDVRPGDIAIIRTGWTDDAPWGTERFWGNEMIYLDPSVGPWLVKKRVKALVYDCYADPRPFDTCKEGGLHPRKDLKDWVPNHTALLKAGIPLISFCRNLRAIKKPRVLIVALPLKLKGTDGAPARVIAIEED